MFPAVAVAEVAASAGRCRGRSSAARNARRGGAGDPCAWMAAWSYLDVEPMKGGGPARAARGDRRRRAARWRRSGWCGALRPKAVLSVGGAAAGPVLAGGGARRRRPSR